MHPYPFTPPYSLFLDPQLTIGALRPPDVEIKPMSETSISSVLRKIIVVIVIEIDLVACLVYRRTLTWTLSQAWRIDTSDSEYISSCPRMPSFTKR